MHHIIPLGIPLLRALIVCLYYPPLTFPHRTRVRAVMHGIRNKKRSSHPDKTSLPGLGEGELNSRGQRISLKYNKRQPKRTSPKNSRATKIGLPTINVYNK